MVTLWQVCKILATSYLVHEPSSEEFNKTLRIEEYFSAKLLEKIRNSPEAQKSLENEREILKKIRKKVTTKSSHRKSSFDSNSDSMSSSCLLTPTSQSFETDFSADLTLSESSLPDVPISFCAAHFESAMTSNICSMNLILPHSKGDAVILAECQVRMALKALESFTPLQSSG